MASEETTETPAQPEGASPAAESAPEKPAEATTFTREQVEEMLNSRTASLNDEITKARRETAATQAYVQNLIQAAQNAGAQAPSDNGPDIRERMSEDPVGVLDQHFATRMSPLIQQNLEYQVGMAEALFKQRFAGDDDYKDYKDEFEEFMRGIPSQVKANPAAWENALDFVRAKHLNDIIAKRSKRIQESDKRAFVESPTGSAPAKAKKLELTDDMKAIAKGLGMKEEEYIEWAGKEI